MNLLLEETVNTVEKAWGAGFFDGEGSSFINKMRPGQGRPVLVVSVGQSSDLGVPDTLLRLQQVIGGNVYKMSMSSPSIQGRGYKQKYKLQLYAAKARHAMAVMIPYLGEAKLEQYDRARERLAQARGA